MIKTKVPTQKPIARQEKIKAVALDLFLTKGYHNTSLSDIIKISGGSYTSIYNAFRNKEGLFFEILNDVCKKHFETISSKIADIKSDKLDEFLYSFGLSFVEIFNTPQSITFAKIIYSQVYSEDKTLVEWIKNNQKNFAFNILVQCFQKQKNKYLAQNAQKLADMFCVMLKEPFHSLNVLTDLPLMSKKEQEKHVKFVSTFFLNSVKMHQND